MNKVKQFMNKITDKNAQGGEGSPGIVHASEDTEGQLSAEGFLCPDCMTAFSSPEALGDHYEKKHANVDSVSLASERSTEPDFDVAHQQILELRFAVENERKHSAELHREVVTLRNQLDSRKNSISSSRSQDLPEDDQNSSKQDERVGQLIDEIKRLSKEARERSSEIDRLKKEITTLESSLKAAAEQTTEAGGKEIALQEKCSSLQKDIDNFRVINETLTNELATHKVTVEEVSKNYRNAVQQYAELEEKLKSDSESHTEEVKNLKQHLTKSQTAATQSEAHLHQLQEEVKRLNREQNELISKIGGDEAQAAVVESLNKEKESLKVQLRETESEKQNVSEGFALQLQTLNEKSEELKKSWEEKIKVAEKTIREYSSRLKEKEEILSTEKSNCNALKLDLEKLKAELEEQKKNSVTLSDDLSLSETKVISLKESVAQLTERIAELEKELEKSKAEVKSATEKFEKAEAAATTASASYTRKIEELEAYGKEITSTSESLKNQNITLAERQQQSEREFAKLSEEKKKLEKHIDAFKADHEVKLANEKAERAKMESELELEKIRSREDEKKYTENLGKIQKELGVTKAKIGELTEELKSQKETAAAEAESMRKLSEGYHNKLEERTKQLNALKENSEKIKSELNELKNESKRFQDSKDSLEAEKLVLEKKYKASEEARALLLERCLAGESESEKYQSSIQDLQRKLEDALSALQELGRENQSLQVESAKQQGRKWADDSVVTNCLTCNKDFSITVRKHHCRVCGNIFCNECSSRTASIPSSKKPVRVCDSCYEELSSK